MRDELPWEVQKWSDQAFAAYAEQQTAFAGSTFGPSPSSKLGQALGQDPITQAVSTKVSTRVQEATTKYSTAPQQAAIPVPAKKAYLMNG